MKVRIAGDKFSFEVFSEDAEGKSKLLDGVRELEKSELELIEQNKLIKVENGKLVEDLDAMRALKEAKIVYDERKQKRSLKKYLEDTDYVPLKMIEAFFENSGNLKELSNKYGEVLKKRQEARDKL